MNDLNNRIILATVIVAVWGFCTIASVALSDIRPITMALATTILAGLSLLCLSHK
jgi:hypothetical protein